jgi:hypothetical protein
MDAKTFKKDMGLGSKKENTKTPIIYLQFSPILFLFESWLLLGENLLRKMRLGLIIASVAVFDALFCVVKIYIRAKTMNIGEVGFGIV